MTKKTFVKVFSAAALLVLLTPVAASAHGFGFNLGGDVKAGENHRDFDHKDKKDKSERHDKDQKWQNKSATTSASVITKASARITDMADLMASMSATVGAKISGSGLSADAKADANANLSDYNENLVDAKAEASAAATVAAKIDADNSTSTNASFITEARANLTAAKDFLKAAKEELRNIFRSLWNA